MFISQTTIPRAIGLLVLSAVLIGAGLYHEAEPQGFAAMLPGWVPMRLPLIRVTAIAEVVFGILLFYPQLRKATGWLLALYFIAIFPANIYAAIEHIPAPGSTYTPAWQLWLRLVFQVPLIWLAIWSTREPRNSRF